MLIIPNRVSFKAIGLIPKYIVGILLPYMLPYIIRIYNKYPFYCGITIVALGPERDTDQDFYETIMAAINDIKDNSHIYYKRLVDNIRIIARVDHDGSLASYHNHLCLINYRKLCHITSRERVIQLAGVLVHEATHGCIESRLNSSYICSNKPQLKIETLALRSQLIYLNKRTNNG